MRGVWVYEIGTSPYFSNVAPGEVLDFPPDASSTDDPEVDTDLTDPVYTDGQQVEYPPYEREGEQIQVVPVQYQPPQPGNSEVVVVDEGDINVDGEPRPSPSFSFVFVFCLILALLCVISDLVQ